MADITRVSSDDLITWLEKLSNSEISPHNQIASLPFSLDDTKEELNRRLVQHKWYSQKYPGPYQSEIDDMIENDRS